MADLDYGQLERTPQISREFDACLDLASTVELLLQEVREAHEWLVAPASLAGIVVATFARSTQTYRAVLLLADRGFGPQGGMLNRSLFEHTVVTWWMFFQDDRDAIVRRLQQHYNHYEIRFDRQLRKYGDNAIYRETIESRQPRTFDDEYEALLDDLFGKHGGKPWTGLGLHAMVQLVEDKWGTNEFYSTSLAQVYDFVNTWNNYMLHHSAYGVSQAVDWPSEDVTPAFKFGPSRDWIGSVLFAAFWSYGLAVLCVLRWLSPRREDNYAAFLHDRSFVFKSVTEAERRACGLEDPCPCGRERTFGQCHAD